jgi:hypothetical protein
MIAVRESRGAGRSSFWLIGAALLLGVLLTPAAHAQPFNIWLGFTGASGYDEIPHSSALNPTGAFTIEAWVDITNSTAGEDCRSIAGKGYTQAWWIGQCNVGGQPTLRSYLKGSGSARSGGIIPRGVWTHVAVTFDGATRRHYIDGELAASFAETGPLTTSTSAMRIGSDVGWVHSPAGSIDEVRLWNVARSTSQIRSKINVRINADEPGLVGVWSLDATPADIVGGHGGALTGTGVGYLTFAAGPTSCGSSTVNALCLQGRFQITTKFRNIPPPGGPTNGDGHVVIAGANSGIFWFFSSDNWEIMVKAINGCGLNSRYWIYSAATTDQFYRMEVFDFQGLKSKIYFNYPGSPAPAVTDSDAFATCP